VNCQFHRRGQSLIGRHVQALQVQATHGNRETEAMNRLAGQTLGSPPRGYLGGKSAIRGSSWTGTTVLVARAELSDQVPVDLLKVTISPGVAGAAGFGLASGERP
jgi:hypothetical protein